MTHNARPEGPTTRRKAAWIDVADTVILDGQEFTVVSKQATSATVFLRLHDGVNTYTKPFGRREVVEVLAR